MSTRFYPKQKDYIAQLNEMDDTIIGGSLGDVIGPGTAIDSNVAAFDGITGNVIKDSGIPLDDVVTDISTKIDNDVSSVSALSGIVVVGITYIVSLTQIEYNKITHDSETAKIQFNIIV